jgi:hypothetical protein
VEVVSRFVDGADISLGEYLRMCGAAGAISLPTPAAKHDEVVMLLEDDGFYAEGTAPSPFAKYREM